MSSPSDPVEMVSTSIDLGFFPNFMIEPLPKLRSIWDSAASRAFDLSMELPSTRRNAAGAMSLLLMTTIRRADNEKALRLGGSVQARPMYTICSLFAICSFHAMRSPHIFDGQEVGPKVGQ